ncbi:BRCA1-A complex subunit RAP80 isoform X1 [Sorex araneus]|uniref:BRCA1-A complex subunit RAP80 isoform X1 n=1 Tax=Sorex araneus TaxID=42254 RepID=UPI00243395FA|nr:BRCA1-A complex subunit RAP80 isoform X1 [Sorex araneus]
MPRRKKKVKDPAEPHSVEKTEVETSSSSSVKRKRRVEDAFIVISDSEGEEPKEENGLQNTKMKQSNRAKGLAKRKIAQMTEEEQFELALQMSEQEARAVNSQEEEEEALLRKAIAESLNSCRPSDAPASSSGPPATGPSSSQSHQENTTDSGTTEGKWHLGPPSLFKGSLISQGNEAEDREEPWDHPESTEEESGCDSSGSWEQSNSPVFENGNANCADRCTGHLTAHTVLGKPQETTGKGSAYPQAAQGRGDTARPCWPAPAEAKCLQDAEGTVHYFWGVPFCPAGVDPNQYTKVILCQLEVYQKSLKKAQRQLLRKKGFGDPVLPSPPSLIQSECGQGDQASEQKEGSSEDAGDEDTEVRQETRATAWHAKPTDFRESPVESLQENLLLEEEQPTTSHGQSSQGLFLEGTSEERNSVSASKSVATLPSKRSSVPRPEGSAEEITVCPETQLSSPETLDPEREVSSRSRETLDKVKVVMTKKEVGSGDAEKKARPSSFLSSIQVSCPLCNQGFPPAKIELHAMYCNGLVEQETVLTRRQKEARSRSLGETSDADKNEKCYLCKARVPFRDYHGHVMACLRLAKKATSSRGETSGHWQHSGSSAEGRQPPPRRQGNPKEKGRSEGRLLSVLEQSEHQTADAEVKVESSGAGTCRVPSSGMEEAGCSRERPTSLAALNLSESPIKSFVPVSEATDCLVDFKKQLAAPPGSRPRTKGGRGRRKKS